jgi:hypothetical protein
MILSRAWYVLLGLAVAVAMYVVYIAVGQYDRQAGRALREGLASDSQTVEWALKIDARRRLDALLAGSVDSALQQALVEANGPKDGKVPDSAKQKAKRALAAINDGTPADWRDDALFAVNRDGQVVGALGYDIVAGNDEFELGGYPAVNDALHGWLRDDVWLLGSKMYVVVTRPVEYDATQRPAGAIVGLKEVSQRFASDLAKRTRTALAFYAGGTRVAAGVGVDGFDEEKLDAVGADLSKIDDKTYGEGGRSEVRMLTDDLGAMYARLPGDVWTQGGGFAVSRSKAPLGGPMGFLANADDKDKANVPWPLLGGIALVAALLGIAMTVLEHTLPLRELVMQADRLKVGVMDGLQVARFRGAYRLAAQALNQGMERSIEKAGGVTRKPADLESIIGPVPAQPAMSAFSFPNADGEPAPGANAHAPQGPGMTQPMPSPRLAERSGALGNQAIGGAFPGPAGGHHHPPRPSPGSAQRHAPPPLAHMPPGPPGASPIATPPLPTPPLAAPPPLASTPQAPPPAPFGAPPPALHSPAAVLRTPPPVARPNPAPPAAPAPLPPPPPPSPSSDDEDETMVGAAPAEVLARATGELRAQSDENAEWLSVFDDFIRTKKQCGEATDGLTFDKFSHTLKKNRDALVARHGCKRVRFSVYVKEGRASLKATPVKE